MKRLLSLITLHEGGFVPKTYLDTEGLRTWGIGWCLDRRPIEDEEAAFILQRVKSDASPDTLKSAPTLAIFLDWLGKERYDSARELAELVLVNEVIKVDNGLAKNIPCWPTIDYIRKMALTDMGYNMGVGGLLTFKNTLRLICERRYDEAADNILASTYAKQTKTRAVRIAGMIRTGEWPSDIPLESKDAKE